MPSKRHKKAEEIKKRKLEDDCPSPPKKERSEESKSHVLRFFIQIKVDGVNYTQNTAVVSRYIFSF